MDLPGRIRADLTAALRERDRDTARVLRSVLSAIANADECLAPAADLEARGATDAAAAPRTDAAVLERYLG